MQHFLFALMFAALPLAAFADQHRAADPTVNFDTNDPIMEKAISDARATLPLFLKQTLDGNGDSKEGALLKLAIPSVSGIVSFEHIWAGPFQRKSDDQFIAVLANQPRNLPGLNAGSVVEVSMSQISDWAWFSEEGGLFGGYTMRAIRDSGQSDGNAVFDQLSKDPVPKSWLDSQ